ncbi:GreA/GreB family elongation factor [Patescibacteria group bacterium]|nr:GreA/GreB family elongation factor [Patescibacteria group bacterium]
MNQVLLTQKGFEKLSQELQELKSKKDLLVSRIEEVAQPDESGEDGLAVQLKEELALISSKLEKLEEVLAIAKIISGNINTNQVEIGTKVRIKLQDKAEKEFFIVSKYEADPARQMISDQSPLGEALLGKKVNESIDFEAPVGKLTYKIISIGSIV